MKRIDSKYIETGSRWLVDHSLILNDQGLIEKICPQAEADRLPLRYEEELDLGQMLLLPGCVNTHSHAFQILLRPSMGQPRHFQDWVDRFLYPLVLELDEDSLYASALLAFSEMLRGGITTVGEFFYVHNLNDGVSSRQRHAHAVIQAAREVGIRISLLRTLYDQGEKAGQMRFREPAEQALAQTRELAADYARTPGVTVMPAPHSLHGASRELIEGAAELAAELNTPWHIHLAEQQGDADFALKTHGLRPLQCLEHWGVLSERTSIVHGIWLEDAELDLMARRRVGLAYNPVTNMALGDGIARIPELLQRGIRVGLGTDANLSSDLFAEARMTEYLQRTRSLAMGCIPDARLLLSMLNRNGGQLLGLSVGQLEAGFYGDFLVIDPEHPSLLPAIWQESPETALLNQLLFSMLPQEAIRQVWVAGAPVVEAGETLRVSRRQIRQALHPQRQGH
ncbi:MAG: S-adenosylhomocysteine deaminase [Candidatus Melainabacteria bacterium HGW-Melainabacteria-1]|nr:MAG: S-adenosylhomocysteine deaminase [Candidatus Melainabacteria bacterium HGW-Melainabacteria-1]